MFINTTHVQVEKNLVKDVLLKIATNVEHHRQYNDTLKKSQQWIEDAREIIRASSDAEVESSKEKLQKKLHQVCKVIINFQFKPYIMLYDCRQLDYSSLNTRTMNNH